MTELVFRFLEYANWVFLFYFLAANTVYTILMCLSLYAVSLHSRFAAEKPYNDMEDSPVTPPVTLIVPAFNEESAIVRKRQSVMRVALKSGIGPELKAFAMIG